MLFRKPIQSEMDIHLAIHSVATEAKRMQFDLVKQAKLKTTVSELGYNIVKYAGRGTVAAYEVNDIKTGLKIIVKDKGPGIEDIEKALGDHFSSSGTLGLGLPGVKRMVDKFDIQSVVSEGTTVTVIVY